MSTSSTSPRGSLLKAHAREMAERLIVVHGRSDTSDSLPRWLERAIATRTVSLASAVRRPQDTVSQLATSHLLEVDDTLESLLELNAIEGTLLNRGARTAVDLSVVRGSAELLSEGGTASGPVSFMRGTDAWARELLAGIDAGHPRTVSLAVDHPDIEQFVAQRGNERQIFEAMREAGQIGADEIRHREQITQLLVTLDGRFIAAAADGHGYALHRRTDGQPASTLDAGQLLRTLGDSIVSTGQPGVIFQSALDTWYGERTTVICGMGGAHIGVPGSAILLASLDVLRCTDSTGGLDLGVLAQTVAALVEALDMLIEQELEPSGGSPRGQALQPRRGLGINLENLRAGAPVGNDGHETVPGLVASLVSALAHRRSAELAARHGAYEMWAADERAQIELLSRQAQHFDELAESVHTNEVLRSAGRRAWDGALEQARATGLRNASVTLLADANAGLARVVDRPAIESSLFGQLAELARLGPTVSGGVEWPIVLSDHFNADDVAQVILAASQTDLRSLRFVRAA